MDFKSCSIARSLKNPNTSLISQRATVLTPSLTLEISAKAKELKEAGKDICSMSAGEPDFDTPDFIVEAAVKALRNGITRYGPAAGDPELREAIAIKQTKVNKVPTQRENVLVTNGGKQAIYNLFQVTLNPEDEVLIPSPYWLSYPEMVLLAGAKPVLIESSPKNGFKLEIEKLEKKVTEKTRLLVLNSPCNPTGQVITKIEMENIAEFLRRHPKIMLMSDEIYEFLLAKNQTHHSFASIAPDLINRIFTVNGFAKGWAMTGWRIGYLTGQTEVIQKATALQSQSTSNVCSFAQRGALAALHGPQEPMKEMISSYNSRRELLTQGLKSIKGIQLSNPKGAFYAFPQITTKKISSIEFCKIALEEVGLSMVPGIAFGDDSCIRLSCAVSSETIAEGIQRLKKLITNL